MTTKNEKLLKLLRNINSVAEIDSSEITILNDEENLRKGWYPRSC